MNVEQRVLAALRREQPDRVPVFIYLNPYVDSWCSDDPSYGDLLEAVRQHADVIYDWNFPMGFMCSGARLPTETERLADGATRHILHTPAGAITSVTAPDWRGEGQTKRWITTVQDARRVLSVPYAPPRPDLGGFHRQRSRLADLAVAQVTFPDPICVVGDLTGPETLALWTLENRDLLKELLDVAFERIRQSLAYCLAGGVGPIYYFNGPEFALPPLMSPRDFEDFVVAYDSKLVRLIHSCPGRYVIVHSHGRVNAFLERFAAIGVDGLNVLEPPPLGDVLLSEAKSRVGKQYCLIGNLQYDDLARATPAQVERLVVTAIRQGGPGGGFILSPCASPYERPLPEKASRNLIQYLVKGREHGRYPLRV